MCRGKGSVMTKSEVNIRCFASGDHSWGTADIYSAALQKGINISYTEKKSSSNLSSRAAALQNDPISPYGAEEGDKAFSRIQEADDKCEKHEEVLKSPKSVSGRLIFMESPPCTPRPKAEYVLCQGCPVVEQGLSTPALLPGPVEILDVKCCKPGTNDTSLSPAVRTPYTVDGADNRVTHRIAMLKQANNGGKAEESRYSHERSEAKHREGAQESRGGSNPVKKVSICITNYSLRCTLSDASM